jgi:glucan 1,3-beta-glucosidase
MYYYTQLVGDAVSMPTIIASSAFDGPWLLDSDPYIPGGNGAQWYTNQNNFFRQVRNFKIDTTQVDPSVVISGIHWQVAQATSLQNIVFEMPTGATSTHQGIFMDNGSGGFMSDLIFNGGKVGAFLGNQQFTSRNLTFNGCNTAIYMNWNWLWTFKSVTINNCGIGLDMSGLDAATSTNQTVGSIVMMDSTIIGTQVGIKTSFNETSLLKTAGTLILDNVDCTGATTCIVGADGTTSILAGGAIISSWGQGTFYQPESGSSKVKRVPQAAASSTSDTCNDTTMAAATTTLLSETATVTNTIMATGSSNATITATPTASNGTAPNVNYGNSTATATSCTSSPALITSKRSQQELTAPSLPPALLDSTGKIFERSKPQYEDVDLSNFVSIKSAGAAGDGVTDDTDAVQNAMNNLTADQILYFDHGAYLITKPVQVPKNIKMVGEIWPLIMISGTAFQDATLPVPVFSIGVPGDIGIVEISDLIFETQGAAPGAIMMEWNVQGANAGDVGMWDTHFRIGGSAGTHLQEDTCIGNTTDTQVYNPSCAGSAMMLHITQQASAYLENTWLWAADHELDMAGHNETNIYNGRGMSIESLGPVWLYGTSVEHNQLYNYQVANAQNIFMGAIQTETAYMQSAPDALNAGYSPLDSLSDPMFSTCTDELCKKTWGLRIFESSDVYVYGAGLYSFFDDYQQACLLTESCQDNMVSIECSSDVYLYGLNTKAATNMVVVDGVSQALQSDNENGFCQTIALFEAQQA